jgi:endonuclease III
MTRPYTPQIERMDAVPGVNHRVAEVVLSEAGPDASAFPTDAHLSRWSGMSPGSDESTGKRRSGRKPAVRSAILASSNSLWMRLATRACSATNWV